MFDRIVAPYDLLNRLTSLGGDGRWRRTAVALAEPRGLRVLDLATGTGDLALGLLEAGAESLVAVDFSSEMLGAAKRKLHSYLESGRARLAQGDALALPFGDGVFDRVASAFLLRNLADLRAGLEEMRRVLKPGGQVVALDITHPPEGGLGRLASAYFRRVVPWLGGVISGDWGAYRYLAQSVGPLPDPDALRVLIAEAGFEDVGYSRMGWGLVAVHWGRRA